MNTTGLASLLLVSALALPTTAFAVDEHNVVSGLTATGAPLGLHGIDPVATLSIGNPIEGLATYAAVHDGVAYYFASEKNVTIFNKNPERYIPQNGGFCTFGVSKGKKFDGDPQYSSVVDGKLYVFLNENIFKLFLKNQQDTIAKAEAQWKDIQSTAAVEL